MPSIVGASKLAISPVLLYGRTLPERHHTIGRHNLICRLHAMFESEMKIVSPKATVPIMGLDLDIVEDKRFHGGDGIVIEVPMMWDGRGVNQVLADSDWRANMAPFTVYDFRTGMLYGWRVDGGTLVPAPVTPANPGSNVVRFERKLK